MSLPTRAGLALASLSLLFWPVALDGFELPRQLALVLATAALLGERGVRTPAAAVWVVSLAVGAGLISTITAEAPLQALVGVEQSRGGLVAVLVWGTWFLAVASVGRPWWAPVVLASWPISLYAWVQALGFDPLAWGNTAQWCESLRPFSTLGHPFQLGAFLAMVLPLALELTWDARGGAAKLGWGLTAVVVVATELLTMARGGWLAAAAALALWAWARFPSRARLLGVSAVLVVALLAGWAAAFESPLALRLRGLWLAPTRLQLWRTAWDAFLARPIQGWGLDGFQLASQRFRPADAWVLEWGATPQHAHSFPAQLLATQGVVGLLAFALVAWRLAVGLRQSAAGVGGAAPVPVPVPALLGCLGAFVVVALLGFHSTVTVAFGLAALGAALEGGPVVRVSRRAMLVVLAALAVLTGRALTASVIAHQASQAKALGEGREAHARFLAASRVERENPRWSAEAGAVAEQLGVEAVDPTRRAEWLTQARQDYHRAREASPALAVLSANEGRVAALLGDFAASRLDFRHARALAPRDARIELDASRALIREGALGEGRALAADVLVQYPFYGPAWWTMANLASLEGRPLEERALLQSALEADWRDWPQGEPLAQGRLAQALDGEGDAEGAARLFQRRPSATSTPEKCGAPMPLGLRGR